MALMLAAMGLLFAVLHGPFRQFEAHAAVFVLHALGVHGVFDASAARIGVVPAGGAAFQAVVTTSCSSLSAILAVLCLGSSIRPHGQAPAGAARTRRVALAAAAMVIFAGNVVRIATAVAIGTVAGRASLVLFHDWVGSAFALAYTIGGYVLMLWLLLPADAAPVTGQEVTIS